MNKTKTNLLKLLLTATIIGCNPVSNQKNTSGERAVEKPHLEIREDARTKEIINPTWNNLSEYDKFVRSMVNKFYAADLKEIYDFYNIKKDLPKYGFKQSKRQLDCFDCEGAVFKESADSIYFYSSCLEELFEKYIAYHENDEKSPKEELTKRIHHWIKHEGAHDIYCKFGKEIGKKNLFKEITNTTSMLEVIQYTLVEEGIAEYISYKGELTKSAKEFTNNNYKTVAFTDEDFKKMIEKEDDSKLYQLGFRLVKPILDIDFEKGIKELIKNPLTKKDLNDLPGYRAKRIENLSKTLEE
jgi:hypothetical protein